MPGSLSLTGRLFDEARLLAVGAAIQRALIENHGPPPVARFLAEHGVAPPEPPRPPRGG